MGGAIKAIREQARSYSSNIFSPDQSSSASLGLSLCRVLEWGLRGHATIAPCLMPQQNKRPAEAGRGLV